MTLSTSKAMWQAYHHPARNDLNYHALDVIADSRRAVACLAAFPFGSSNIAFISFYNSCIERTLVDNNHL